MKTFTAIFLLLPFAIDALFCFVGSLGVLVTISACSILASVSCLVWGACVARHRLSLGLCCIGVGLLQVCLLLFAVTKIHAES
jgi:hypothetical protein